jgi:hypothetical protein
MTCMTVGVNGMDGRVLDEREEEKWEVRQVRDEVEDTFLQIPIW